MSQQHKHCVRCVNRYIAGKRKVRNKFRSVNRVRHVDCNITLVQPSSLQPSLNVILFLISRHTTRQLMVKAIVRCKPQQASHPTVQRGHWSTSKLGFFRLVNICGVIAQCSKPGTHNQISWARSLLDCLSLLCSSVPVLFSID